jgi:hypothetical protein
VRSIGDVALAAAGLVMLMTGRVPSVGIVLLTAVVAQARPGQVDSRCGARPVGQISGDLERVVRLMQGPVCLLVDLGTDAGTALGRCLNCPTPNGVRGRGAAIVAIHRVDLDRRDPSNGAFLRVDVELRQREIGDAHAQVIWRLAADEITVGNEVARLDARSAREQRYRHCDDPDSRPMHDRIFPCQ